MITQRRRSLETARSAAVARPILIGVFCAVAITITGCLKQMLLLGYLIGGPPSNEPAFTKETEVDLTDHGIKVAVVCIAKKDIRYAHGELGQKLTAMITNRLEQNHIVTVHVGRVLSWLDKNKDWMDSAMEIGEDLGADYVIMVDLYKYSIWEKGSSQMMRGKAEARVEVFDINADDDRPIFSQSVNEAYPTTVARPTSQTPPATFKNEFLDRLSKVIGRMFHQWYNGDDISDAA